MDSMANDNDFAKAFGLASVLLMKPFFDFPCQQPLVGVMVFRCPKEVEFIRVGTIDWAPETKMLS
jgi:hypothetical protein